MIQSPPRNPTQPVPYTKAYSGGVDSQTATAAPTNPTTPVPYQKTHAHDTAADTVEQGSSSNASTSITPFADSTARTSTSRTMDRTQTTTERPARDELDGSASVVGLDASLQSGQSASGLRETIRVLTERMNELDVPPPYEDDREVRPP
ncbi:hypothetical protein BDV98DRAFT_576808 [Pterulicium gracile]|uniref:Uncharacterized protein n=1 Tax=Pterulicium gracile TaxID=1884261 RepID=A0A5C3Q4C4_9AGAR|nr:hypothetical protein BDV98DRAFT_576808 [Pterula gracilis]